MGRAAMNGRRAGGIAALLAGAAGFTEWCMGRVVLARSGRLLLWVNQANGPETSQQLLDWYSLSHVLHGVLFYAGLYGMPWTRRWPVAGRFLMAVAIECAWEVLENSPLIIERYRQTNATAYAGDTVLNSMSDIACCALGFVLAARLPAWASVVLVVAVEVVMLWWIHDNLTLNIVMLVHPFAAVRQWQSQIP